MVVVSMVEVFKLLCLYLLLMGCTCNVVLLHVLPCLLDMLVGLLLHLPTITAEKKN